jgi:hypothetical protein
MALRPCGHKLFPIRRLREWELAGFECDLGLVTRSGRIRRFNSPATRSRSLVPRGLWIAIIRAQQPREGWRLGWWLLAKVLPIHRPTSVRADRALCSMRLTSRLVSHRRQHCIMQQPSMRTVQAGRVPECDTDPQLGLEGMRLVEVVGIFG